MNCKLIIDEQPFQFEVDGDFSSGSDEILFHEKGNVLELVPWKTQGYSNVDIFNEKEFSDLKKSIHQILSKITKDLTLDFSNLKLSDYHKLINTRDLHQQVISKTRFLTAKDFAVDLDQISARISERLGRKVGIYNPKLEEEIIILRISRPDSMDINPLHRDGYLDIWKDTINVWIPIAGCNSFSSLPVIPGSHYWNESDVVRTQPKGASINGLTYHVPGIVKGPETLNAVRPNPQYGQALLFSPFLVHGAAINQNKDSTRMSLELRLCLQ